jgi:hypothetical protein
MPTNHVTATYDHFLLTSGGPFSSISFDASALGPCIVHGQTDPSTPFSFPLSLWLWHYAPAFHVLSLTKDLDQSAMIYFSFLLSLPLIPHGFFYLIFHALFLSRQSHPPSLWG